MAARVTRGTATRAEAVAAIAVGGASTPRAWSNGPGDRYGWHEHPYRKLLFCVGGSIVFHTDEGDLTLEAGDRLDLEPGTRHAATVGPAGCACIEATAP
jgi:quercetin dioxygenase-like cupin family protein